MKKINVQLKEVTDSNQDTEHLVHKLNKLLQKVQQETA